MTESWLSERQNLGMGRRAVFDCFSIRMSFGDCWPTVPGHVGTVSTATAV
jgi:hypothetical protein